jgi:hypothetical protein
MSGRSELIAAAVDEVYPTKHGKRLVSLPDGGQIEVRRVYRGIRLTPLGKRVYNLIGRGAEGGES